MFALIALGSGIASIIMTIEYTEVFTCQSRNFHSYWEMRKCIGDDSSDICRNNFRCGEDKIPLFIVWPIFLGSIFLLSSCFVLSYLLYCFRM
jgi:hypothetical protein